jgi:uncharacterized peroxidase-related enzyme
MPHISLLENLPGIISLLEYRKDTAAPIRELTQILLRGASTLTEAERELIATVVSYKNECRFCTTSHTVVVDAFLGEEETCNQVKQNFETANVSDKLKALLAIATQVQQSGKAVTKQSIDRAKQNGVSDVEIHDTVLIAALFCMYNRYVDGLATIMPSENSNYFEDLATRLTTTGYYRNAEGYNHITK